MSEYAIRALDATTGDAFARLVEKHNGCGFGGCWCTGSIRERAGPKAKKAAPGRSVSFARGKRTPPWSSTATTRWRGANTARRRSFRASSPKGMGGRSHGGTACLSHHVHLRRQGLSAERRRSCGGSWCPRSDREGGRRGVEGYPHDLQGEKIRSQFLYRHAQPLRGGRLQLRATQGKEELRDAQDGFTVAASRRARVG